jgi:hypothetical protein
MTPRERVEIALGGGHGDRVPFTMYENKAHQCEAEREMRNRGMCIVERRVPTFRTHRPDCDLRERIIRRGGRRMIERVVETPHGSLTWVDEPAGFTTWHHERPFRSPDDYAALRFYLADEQYEPNYAAFEKARRDYGGDAIFRTNFGYEPMQRLVSGDVMSTEQWCFEWMERRDEVLALYEIIVAR